MNTTTYTVIHKNDIVKGRGLSADEAIQMAGFDEAQMAERDPLWAERPAGLFNDKSHCLIYRDDTRLSKEQICAALRVWAKWVQQDASAVLVGGKEFKAPEGYVYFVKGISALLGQDGQVKLQWIKTILAEKPSRNWIIRGLEIEDGPTPYRNGWWCRWQSGRRLKSYLPRLQSARSPIGKDALTAQRIVPANPR